MHAAFPVLLVEDSPDDAFFVKRAFASAGLNHPLIAVEDGSEAIEYLCGKGKYADRSVFPVPGLCHRRLEDASRYGVQAYSMDARGRLRETDSGYRYVLICFAPGCESSLRTGRERLHG